MKYLNKTMNQLNNPQTKILEDRLKKYLMEVEKAKKKYSDTNLPGSHSDK